ncbi:MAG: hypothetical protein EOP53_16085 [Sphingobacteriales bacterium]|nr:MAG: hypothetical protein EOP53_16085 [Sphingobacteriales bacterium]
MNKFRVSQITASKHFLANAYMEVVKNYSFIKGKYFVDVNKSAICFCVRIAFSSEKFTQNEGVFTASSCFL